MAESLLVRKGGGGGLKIEGDEYSFTSRETIKTGEFVELQFEKQGQIGAPAIVEAGVDDLNQNCIVNIGKNLIVIFYGRINTKAVIRKYDETTSSWSTVVNYTTPFFSQGASLLSMYAEKLDNNRILLQLTSTNTGGGLQLLIFNYTTSSLTFVAESGVLAGTSDSSGESQRFAVVAKGKSGSNFIEKVFIPYRFTSGDQFRYRFVIIQNSTFLTIGSQLSRTTNMSATSNSIKAYATGRLASLRNYPGNVYLFFMLIRNADNNIFIYAFGTTGLTSTTAFEVLGGSVVFDSIQSQSFDAAILSNNSLGIIGANTQSSQGRVRFATAYLNRFDGLRVNNQEDGLQMTTGIPSANRLVVRQINSDIAAGILHTSSGLVVAVTDFKSGARHLITEIYNIDDANISGANIAALDNRSFVFSTIVGTTTLRTRRLVLSVVANKANFKNASGVATNDVTNGQSVKVLMPK